MEEWPGLYSSVKIRIFLIYWAPGVIGVFHTMERFYALRQQNDSLVLTKSEGWQQDDSLIGEWKDYEMIIFEKPAVGKLGRDVLNEMRAVWQPEGMDWNESTMTAQKGCIEMRALWQPSRDGLKWEQYDSPVGMDWNENSMAWQPSRDGLKWEHYQPLWQPSRDGLKWEQYGMTAQ